jgi:hypothetical protein
LSDLAYGKLHRKSTVNAFSINPNLVIVDGNQPALMKLLEKEGLDVISLKLRHSKMHGIHSCTRSRLAANACGTASGSMRLRVFACRRQNGCENKTSTNMSSSAVTARRARMAVLLPLILLVLPCSWLNMVERFFAEITRNRIRRGVFKSVTELQTTIMEYLENHNADPKPFIWTKSAGEILEKVTRAKQALESQH